MEINKVGGGEMIDKIIRVVIGIFGVILGLGIVAILRSVEILNISTKGWVGLSINVGVSLLFGIIFYILSNKIIGKGRKLMRLVENELQKFSVYDISIGSVGLIVGLIIAYLLSQPLYRFEIPYLGLIASIILYGLFGYLGVMIPIKKRGSC